MSTDDVDSIWSIVSKKDFALDIGEGLHLLTESAGEHVQTEGENTG